MEKLAKENPTGNLLLTDMGDGLRGSEFFIPGDHDDYWLRLRWDIYKYIAYELSPPMLGIAGVFLMQKNSLNVMMIYIGEKWKSLQRKIQEVIYFQLIWERDYVEVNFLFRVIMMTIGYV
ncbi:hypothetical protein PVT01_090052700 [Plasmodium vivax]|uniref:Uncharacterized protein n=1 Tax=Plasmodium vivax TaxID=5855 RepID=A0A1G4GY99_PLAVI|nr:hypothetical protein PVT01_090052700 [Plasmodium vivax]